MRLTGLLILFFGLILNAKSQDKPNILWIVSEDNSPHIGCYGDPLAKTPNIDKLATEGIRYKNAFANAPVCSSARSTLITGMYASSLYIHHHRSRRAIPQNFKSYASVMTAAGYYCTNNSKEDYNITAYEKGWSVKSSGKAHYKNRPKGKPFFAVFNLGDTHEGQMQDKKFSKVKKFLVDPSEVKLPPYHPDLPEVREEWSRFYENTNTMDRKVGALLKELEDLGEAENTIVFYYSDHGGPIPRGKRNIHDSGTRVPLVIRFPKKWQHLAPAKSGEWVDSPVSFVDFPATVMSLSGVEIPANYEGVPFLGNKARERDHVYLLRGRCDNHMDIVRAVRDKKFRYVKNFMPHRRYGQDYFYPFRVTKTMGVWFDFFKAGKANSTQARYWQTKAGEELYDLEKDPFEINNLAGNPEYADLLNKMRKTFTEEFQKSNDAGLIPEAMVDKLAEGKTVYEYVRSSAYPEKEVFEMAMAATSGDSAKMEKLKKGLTSENDVVRYWAAVGCIVLGNKSESAKDELKKLTKDSWSAIRTAASEALVKVGDKSALSILKKEINSANAYESFAAFSALEHLDVKLTKEEVKNVKGHDPKEMAERISR